VSTPDLLLLIGMFVGAAVVGLVILFAGIFALIKLGGALAGLPAVRNGLLARGMDRRLADQILVELEAETGGVGIAIFLLLVGVPAVGFGIYELSGMYAPDTFELLLYPAPGALAIIGGLWLFVRGRRIDPDASPLHRAIVTRAANVTALVPTTQLLNINVTTSMDALARTRVTQLRPIPHVAVLFDDGSEHLVRAFHDADAMATEVLRCLHAQLPHARVEAFVPSWRSTQRSSPQQPSVA
jgi:hypothetical protein